MWSVDVFLVVNMNKLFHKQLPEIYKSVPLKQFVKVLAQTTLKQSEKKKEITWSLWKNSNNC